MQSVRGGLLPLRGTGPVLSLCFLIAALAARLPAGPVPGVDSLDLEQAAFPTPGSVEAWKAEGGDYLVRFAWKSERPLERPGVAGDFNGWNRADLPMEGPDAAGTYRVAARIPSGRYRYKFIEGADGWHADPLNQEREADGYGGENSILRLGLSAVASGAEAVRGDGRIEVLGLEHRPESARYRDRFAADAVTLRFATLRGDVDGVELRLFAPGGGKVAAFEMAIAAADDLHDLYEVTLRHGAQGVPEAFAYGFTIRDGAEELAFDLKVEFEWESEHSIDTPDWARDAVWYQIMVDRFRDGDPTNNPEALVDSTTERVDVTHPWTSDWYTEQPYERDGGQTFWKWSMYNRLYGGDFQGVIDKLDDLKALGVTALYLNPVFEASSSHKYNARSFVHADDCYGVAGAFDEAVAKEDLADPSTWTFNASDKKLLELIAACHERGLRIILDGVFNHLGSDALAFQDVRAKGRDSAFADWFTIESWEPFTYKGWAGFDGLPEFRKSADDLASASLKEHVFAVTRRWLDPNGDGDPSDGIDGWRLDVPAEIPRGFWKQWRQVVKETNPEAYIVGEIWGPAPEWVDGEHFDALMNYPFAKAAFRWFANDAKKISVSAFDRELALGRLRYARACDEVLQNLYDSHDTDRWVSRIANPDLDYDGSNRVQDGGRAAGFFDERPGDAAYRRLRLMALFQATYVGAPMIWYGTEVGMFGADDPRCRMPMWWDDLGAYENPTYKRDEALRAEFAQLFAMRAAQPNLRRGDFTTLAVDDAHDVYAYLRHGAAGAPAILVVLNNSRDTQTLALDAPGLAILPGGFARAEALHAPEVAHAVFSAERAEIALPPVAGGVFAIEMEP